MKINWKKIIAREGLIILGIVVASLILLFISKQIYRPMYMLPLDDCVASPQDETDAINKIIDLREKYPQYNDLTNIDLSEKMSKKYPDWQSVYIVMQRINNESIQKHFVHNYATAKPPKIRVSKLSELILSFSRMVLIFGYPVYLLFRFIFWAIKTLKQKA